MEKNIIDGRKIAAELFDEIYKQVAYLPFRPLLCDVIVGDDPVSLSYVKIKAKRAEMCGMEFSLVHLPSDSTEEEVIAAIQIEQEKKNLCGLIVQLPLPKNLDSGRILKHINPQVDVDGINPDVEHVLVPPTPAAIMHLLLTLQIDLSVEKFVVVGQGDLVGKPVAEMLRSEGFDVRAVVAESPNRAETLKSATVVISGVGKAGVITGQDLSDGVIVIDAGTSESGGSIFGDVDFESVAPKTRYITPSPGGVGPVTVAKLLENVLKVALTLDTERKNL